MQFEGWNGVEVVCRAEMGKEARLQVARWDWQAATLHLLHVQYPMAVERFKEQQKQKAAETAPQQLQSAELLA